jgi:methionine aminopeptidase
LNFRISGRVAGATFAVCGCCASALAAAGDLPVGMEAEPTAVTALLRTVVVVWSIILLLFGFKIGRGVIGTMLLAGGLAAGWFLAADVSLLLMLGVSVLVCAVGMAIYIWAPRVMIALAMSWPLPALYLAHLYFAGSFDLKRTSAVALAVIGTTLGALLPRQGLAAVSASLGTVGLLSAGPLSPSFASILVIVGFSLAWQNAVLGAWRSPTAQEEEVRQRRSPPRLRQWSGAVRWAVAVQIFGLFLVATAAPMFDPGRVETSARLSRLAERGALVRPGLAIGSLNNYYLSSVPLPVAIVGERAGVGARLWFPIAGHSLVREIGDLRAAKNENELEAMRRAAEITSHAFADVHPLIKPGVSEAEIEEEILESFSARGATGVAFKATVGSGANAVLPHYERNDAIMADGLVVIDIGCSVDNYASDMTRTFSVTGEYTDAERRLIDVVIEAGDAARGVLGPGVSLNEVDAAARDVIEKAGFGRFFTHSVRHHVGLSVHDPRRNPLEPGMVVTIEPGIYIPAGADSDREYGNLGVRIEDSYIITIDGWEEITDYARRPWVE